MEVKEQAKIILESVGGESNISSITHCVTRLRFVLKDETKIDNQMIEQLDCVLGIQKQAGQFQVIIGAKVEKVYKEILSLLPDSFQSNDKYSDRDSNIKKKNSVFNSILETLTAILIPSLPPIIGGGMIKGFLFMFWQFDWLSMDSPTFIVFNIISDSMFYFYPFLLAVSAAKRFKTNEYMALAIAGALMYPSITSGVAEGMTSIEFFNVLPIPYIDYSASVIPIILSVWAMSYIYNYLQKHIPDLLSTIFTPMLTLLIMIPVALIVIAPLGFYIGDYIAKGIQVLIDFSAVLSGFVIGATRPFLVLTGTHHAMRAIVQQEISTYGYTTIGAMNYMSVMAQATAALGVYLVSRNKKMKNISISSATSGFLGVTEPALYGVIVKYKVVMIATMIGGGIGGAITSAFGSAEYAMVMSSILTIPATFGEGFMGIVIGIPVSIIATLLIIFIGKKSIWKQDEETNMLQNSQETSPGDKKNEKVIEISSPTNGVLHSLSTVKDKTFSNEILGKGISISSSDGVVKSPIDGVVTALYPSKHAIGLTGEQGVEILLHIGIDTVNLKGKYFDPKVKAGDQIRVGEDLLQFDKESIVNDGYDDVVILVVTNTQDYVDIVNHKDSGQVTSGEKLLTVFS
ncbi:beta-glucoside-specific PTS transporter subunit IIABC [Oceanobacillus sojae]|uniref:beta-glucoside-specific PTS transporter subunit IIABC n=1 Tax=Oceanobacillus sojae TaxID=582851 RepID=UPI0021A60DA2|nr:beta-glucoside-specific PTS transporter subunit IIABC [Oceanobacillus sojae]MCT1901995.1 beta-glucoside-specific PTS transporter subunit IIABC [Oceanobacillus sojae]